MGEIKSSYASTNDHIGTSLRMHGDRCCSCLVSFNTVRVGFSSILYGPHINLVLIRLGITFHSSSTYQIVVHLCFKTLDLLQFLNTYIR